MRRGHSPLPVFCQAFLHRIRQNGTDSVEKILTEENVKVRPLTAAFTLLTPATSSLLAHKDSPGFLSPHVSL